MDAIVLLKDDHKTVEKLFRQYEKAPDDAYEQKQQLVSQIVAELSVHAHIEEQIFYPEAREQAPETEHHVLESLEEHHIVKWVLSELDGMDPRDKRYDAKVSVMMENVRHHVEEEETEWFPEVRKAFGRKKLQEIGERLAAAKETAPRSPQPEAPDEPQ